MAAEAPARAFTEIYGLVKKVNMLTVHSLT